MSDPRIVLPTLKISIAEKHYPHSRRSQEELAELADRYQKIGLEQVQTAFQASGLGFEVRSILKPDSYGTGHVIYVVETEHEPLIFRSNTGWGDEPEAVLVAEKLATDIARKNGVSVNEILHVDVSRQHVPFDFQIQRQVPGQDLEDHFIGSQEDYDQLSFQLGQVLAKLHSIEVPGFGRLDSNALQGKLQGGLASNYEYVMLDVDGELNALVENKRMSATQAESIKEFFESRKDLIDINQGVLVHYDVADHNLMFEGREITGLIDWEAVVVSDPVLDLASAPTWVTHYPRLEKMLEGYQSITSLPDNFDEKYNIYRLRTLLWKTVFCENAGILTPVRLKRLTDALKDLRII